MTPLCRLLELESEIHSLETKQCLRHEILLLYFPHLKTIPDLLNAIEFSSVGFDVSKTSSGSFDAKTLRILRKNTRDASRIRSIVAAIFHKKPFKNIRRIHSQRRKDGIEQLEVQFVDEPGRKIWLDLDMIEEVAPKDVLQFRKNLPNTPETMPRRSERIKKSPVKSSTNSSQEETPKKKPKIDNEKVTETTQEDGNCTPLRLAENSPPRKQIAITCPGAPRKQKPYFSWEENEQRKTRN